MANKDKNKKIVTDGVVYQKIDKLEIQEDRNKIVKSLERIDLRIKRLQALKAEKTLNLNEIDDLLPQLIDE